MTGFLALLGVLYLYAVMNRRITMLERRLGMAKEAAMPQTAPQSTTHSPAAPGVVAPSLVSHPDSSGPSARFVVSPEIGEGYVARFIRWCMHEWPVKVGALLVISAVAWALYYAFERDIIGEAGRVSLGLLFGLVLLAVGWRRIAVVRIQGAVLVFVGTMSILLGVLAGLEYGFFTPVLALVALAVVTAAVMLLAVTRDDSALAAFSFLLGALLPLLVGSDLSSIVTTFYLLVLTLGAVACAALRPWSGLVLAVLLTVIAYSIVEDGFGAASEAGEYFLAALFATVFFVGNLSLMRLRGAVSRIEVAIAGVTGLALYGWTVSTVSDDTARAMLLATSALAFVAGAYWLWRRMPALIAPVMVYAAVAAGFIGGATFLLLSGPALAMVMALEIGSLILAVIYLLRDSMGRRWVLAVLAFALPVLLSLSSVGELPRAYYDVRAAIMSGEDLWPYVSHPLAYPTALSVGDAIPHLMAVTVMALVAVLVAMAIVRWSMRGTIRSDATRHGDLIALRIFGAIGGAYVAFLIWAVLHIALTASVATMIAILIYTVVGVAFYVSAVRDRYVPYKVIGGVILALVAGRLFLVEFWEMGIVARIAVFAIVGALFISTTFLARRRGDTGITD